MAKNKGARLVITLECKTPEGVYRYTTTKNRRNTPNRLYRKLGTAFPWRTVQIKIS